MDAIDWSSVIPAGFALVIFLGGLVMLISGMLEAGNR
jgi:hypothetical protein